MASIFTYDPEPPKISSPWGALTPQGPGNGKEEGGGAFPGLDSRTPSPMLDLSVQKLEAEPQDGPTEYKLHLLLRPRRIISATSASVKTGRYGNPASESSTSDNGAVPTSSDAAPLVSGPLPSQQSRQQRLQSLTTQLFWRLQQSSPFHSSSSTSVDLVLPVFPESGSALDAQARPRRLLPGLEESQGALYEIGVADDGTLVGLIKDEMEESLNNLRAMAASLGCDVQVLRMHIVGDCEWQEIDTSSEDPVKYLRKDSLWVAEAFVKPSIAPEGDAPSLNLSRESSVASNRKDVKTVQSRSEQLRVSLIGATTSGKSSLLGTLSTSTLDDRRGKSRLNLLKHRHELVSGITSSIANELIGYDPCDEDENLKTSPDPPSIINYATGNISCWTDIHARATTGRLIFFSDSAGQPRYRRTMLRSLVGWAPHWVILCVSGSDKDEQNDTLEYDGNDLDISQSQLDLCIQLGLPVVIVLTKLDRASNAGLKHILAKLLTQLKSSGRLPLPLFEGAVIGDSNKEIDPHVISQVDWNLVQGKLLARPKEDLFSTVPIVLTSAANGSGIGHLHSLLCQLPIPSATTDTANTATRKASSRRNRPIFYIEEIYSFPSAHSMDEVKQDERNRDCVLSGHVKNGNISLGDILTLGPLPLDETLQDTSRGASNKDDAGLSNSQRRRLASGFSRGTSQNGQHRLSSSEKEWTTVRVVSIRNLRLPVRRLLQGQVGTVGVVPHTLSNDSEENASNLHERSDIFTKFGTPKARKGMILASVRADPAPSSYRGLSARFQGMSPQRLVEGVHVTIYSGSVRASARIENVSKVGLSPKPLDEHSEGDLFDFDSDQDGEAAAGESVSSIEVQVEFLVMREWIEEGAQVLLIPGSEKVSSGLESYVGRITKAIG